MAHKKQSRQLGKADSKKRKKENNMKHTDKFAVLRHKETGAFLNEYKSKEGTFAYSADFINDLRYAAKK